MLLQTAGTSSDEWWDWYNSYSNKFSLQHKNGFAPLPLLTSADGKTLLAIPPALTLLTIADLKAQYGDYTTDQIENPVTYSADKAVVLKFDNVRPYAMCGVQYVESITLNVTAASLPAYTFRDCLVLKSVDLSHTGNTIGEYTFSDCTALEYVRFISESINTVESNAFYGCTALKSLWFLAGESAGTVAPDAYPSTCSVTISGQTN